MKIEWTLGKITVAIATVIVLGFCAAAIAKAEGEDVKVFKEVMKACKHSDTGEAMLFFPIPMGNMPPPTLKEIDAYVNSEEKYKKSVEGSSPCWTRERWKIYMRSVLMEQRQQVRKAPGTK